MQQKLWVVVPFYNEVKEIRLTLQALAAQNDRQFKLLLVDNASTDNGASEASKICRQLNLPCSIIVESEKGTGAAANTGFRYAMTHGATRIARTDADCSPGVDWVRQIKVGFADGLEFMGGRLKPRHDAIRPRLLDYVILPTLIAIGVLYGKICYRGQQFKYSFFMAAGGNMAITADVYKKAGGFRRSSIAETNEDTELAEIVRTLTTHASYRRGMVVYASIRRVRKYGYIKLLRWFSGRHYQGEIDIR